ncbi:hypothetical protein ARMGADRAFT_1010996 [Armillaria gallica]|uniref:Extracellular metalloproteinase n=1 Tax=Armillaria gallica TaxID=47427 RepID=A0A2H3DW59_ARMGA|nr:hypothetical protein ARMGADRAFT_1010996 [Armillaria gallica]
MDVPLCKEGDTVWLHLFLDVLSRLSCISSVPSAQDAWIQAHQNRYKGANVYPFASCGLGANAANYMNDTSILSGCRIPSPHIAYCV